MSKCLAFLFGFAIVAAHVPSWSQPSLEPKSAVLLLAGALAWGWQGWKARPMAAYPWTLLLPLGWLLLSACWSPAPFFGLQRVIWLAAAMGVGTWLVAEEGRLPSFMGGFMVGTGIHAFLILVQWIPSVRAVLPPSLGIDPFQGVGRGLFHNTNMAALPFVILAGWLLLSDQGRSRILHLGWVLPALTLTQSRLGIGVCAGLLAYSTLCRNASEEPSSGRSWLKAAPPFVLALAWSLTAHRWGWLLPLGGGALALLQKPRGTEPVRFGRFSRLLPILGLSLAILAGMATRAPKNASQTVVRGTLVQGDVSLSQRLSYYRAAALAFLDHPFTGQGLGSARPIYPQFVDRSRPAAEIAYGDFQRPNNLHSEVLEWLVEGGLLLALTALLGLWLDRSGHSRETRRALLVPVALIALLDFPFHNPLGLLWAGITLAPLVQPTGGTTGRTTRVLHGLAALGLLALAGFQIRVAILRPGVEQRFEASNRPAQTLEEARSLWKCYPFTADLFDLYSKAAIQNAALTADASTIQELDQLLRRDPFDHHLLLCRAQIARRLGDSQATQSLLNRYAAVAPHDPDRYLRLAKTALEQGKPESARQLLAEARRQPGFSPRHASAIEALNSQIRSWSGPEYHP
ncbi:O-antigen ligase family protein [Geothrix oryzae]|nr:O-antigen ligase family protein [Geothrix oryzae]